MCLPASICECVCSLSFNLVIFCCRRLRRRCRCRCCRQQMENLAFNWFLLGPMSPDVWRASDGENNGLLNLLPLKSYYILWSSTNEKSLKMPWRFPIFQWRSLHLFLSLSLSHTQIFFYSSCMRFLELLKVY